MNSTFDLISINTVPPDYSWDLGTPLVEYQDFDGVDVTQETNEFVGYAPFVAVTLSSDPGSVDERLVSIERVADFGDYYNSASNSVMSTTLSYETFCHNYIMPGVYTLRYTVKEYVEREIGEGFTAFPCLEKYCLAWSWNNVNTSNPETSAITWSSTLPGSAYEKLWKFEPCDADYAASGGLYVQPLDVTERYPLSWQWHNFYCSSSANPLNTPIRWEQTEFQGPEQLLWSQTVPCATLNFLADTNISWNWNNLVCDLTANPFSNDISWDELKCTVPTGRTWNEMSLRCNEVFSNTKTISSGITTTVVKEALIRVIEIPPRAYLDLTQPSNPQDRISPLTVRLSPKFTKAGSFPIEKIVWDLGDESPLLTQRRWSTNILSPFVYTGVYNLDYQDPRNFDVVYTYKKTPEFGSTYYPSITAYASSTGTIDCAAVVVGPLVTTSVADTKITLLQNELTESSKVYLAEINNSVVAFRSDK